tara:strand:+ start:7417 stop:8169 length:753 start_codon:yes stop_codon:yes gene_type:complete
MTQEIINQLKNDNEYYNGIGRQFLSNSDIGTLLSNPKEFGAKREDSKAFAMGRYFHQLFLEPEKAMEWDFIDVASRNTKKYKEYVAELSANSSRPRDFALLLKEKREVEFWVEAMKTNLDFFDWIYSDDNKFEVPAVKEICGEVWKGKADIVGKDFLYDLKTTSSISDFKWNSRKYNYDSQAFIYQSLFGKPMMFLVIDKTSLMMGAFTVSDESLERGKRKVEKAVEVYRTFFGDNPTEDINQFYFNEEV